MTRRLRLGPFPALAMDATLQVDGAWWRYTLTDVWAEPLERWVQWWSFARLDGRGEGDLEQVVRLSAELSTDDDEVAVPVVAKPRPGDVALLGGVVVLPRTELVGRRVTFDVLDRQPLVRLVPATAGGGPAEEEP